MECERVFALAHIKEARRIQWDALEQCVVLEALVGPPDGPEQKQVHLTLHPQAALQLLLLLERALSAGTALSERPAQ